VDARPQKRFFIVSTPRTGNVWMRRVLTGVLAIPNWAAWLPEEIAWDRLPADVSMAMHWRRSAAFEGFLRERGFRILVTARHPLDVLLSILQYAPREPDANRWIAGECGNERTLTSETTPVDEAFVRYALSWRASALLDVSVGWAATSDAVLRYGDFVRDPKAELALVLRMLNVQPEEDVDAVLERFSSENTRKLTPGHFWQGTPDLWKRLIVPQLAHAIHDRHRAAFQTFGFACDPDPNLTEAQAHANWRELVAQRR
jgi:hypothetical protein